MTREYDNIPENAWVLARKQMDYGKRKPFNGWVVGETGLCYVVFDPNIQKEVKVSKDYVFSLPLEGETSEEAMEFMKGVEIDMALDRGDRKRFEELTGGEASGTDEELLRPSNGD